MLRHLPPEAGCGRPADGISSSTSTASGPVGILAASFGSSAWRAPLSRADVHHDEDHRVLVALEESAMKIGHAGTENTLEDTPPNDRIGRALEQGLTATRSGLASISPSATRTPTSSGDGFVLERRRGAVRKLIRVEQRSRRVADDEGGDGRMAPVTANALTGRLLARPGSRPQYGAWSALTRASRGPAARPGRTCRTRPSG